MILCIVLMVSLVSQQSLADCNPKDIKQQNYYGEPRYAYPVDCHIDCGRLRKAEPLYKEQVKQLKKSIEFKDLAIQDANKRIDLWKSTTQDLEQIIIKQEENQERMKWIYFGLGILTTGAAVWAAGQIK